MKNKYLILIALAFVIASCVKTKNYYVNDASRAWFADSTNCSFTLKDDNGICYSMRFNHLYQSMLETGTEILFIPTEKAMHECLYQAGASSYNQSLRMSVSLTAYKHDDEHEGSDDFRLYLGEATYAMRIDGNQFYPERCYEEGNSSEMEYTAEYIDSYTVNDVAYNGVMYLKLIDVAYPLSRFFPTEIYYAKHYGLIQCTLGDKLTLYRLPD